MSSVIDPREALVDAISLLPDLIYSAVVPFLGQREALRVAHQGQASIH